MKKQTWNGHEWEVAPLNDDMATVLCLDPVMDNGIDQTDWPSDAEVGRALGFAVKWYDAGDSPRGVEMLYKRVELSEDKAESLAVAEVRAHRKAKR